MSGAAAPGSRSDADGARFVPSRQKTRPEDFFTPWLSCPTRCRCGSPALRTLGRLRLLARAYGDRAEGHSSEVHNRTPSVRTTRRKPRLSGRVAVAGASTRARRPGQRRDARRRARGPGDQCARPLSPEAVRGLADRLAAAAELCVFFLAAGASSRPWLDSGQALGFRHEFLRSVSIPVRRRPPRAPLGLRRRLRRYSPTIVLAAGFSPLVGSRAARHATWAGVPLGIWSGEIATTRAGRSRPRHLQRRRLATRADFAIAYGSLSERYLKQLAEDLPVVIGRNTSVVAAGTSAPPVATRTGPPADRRGPGNQSQGHRHRDRRSGSAPRPGLPAHRGR